MLTVLWHDANAAGFKDFLPDEWFAEVGVVKGRIHRVTGPDTFEHQAKCTVTVYATSADLDYTAYPKFNDKYEMNLGVMRIAFKGPDRKAISAVSWRGADESEFVLSSTTVSREPGEGVDGDGFFVEEGTRVPVYHVRLERDMTIVGRKKTEVFEATGKLACECCNFDFADFYGELGAQYAECHHRLWLSKTPTGTYRLTSTADLAIVCANCHRMLHRDAKLTVESLRKLIDDIRN